MDMQAVKNKDNKFLLATGNFINKISMSLLGKELLDIKFKDANSIKIPGPPINEDVLFVKTEILKRMNFNYVLPEERNGKANPEYEAVKHLTDAMPEIRRDIIQATTKEQLLEALTKSSTICKKTYSSLFSNDLYKDGGSPTLLNFTAKYFDLGSGNPEVFLEKQFKNYEDRKSSGFDVKSNKEPLNNDPYVLSYVGKMIQQSEGFYELQQTVNTVSERFTIPFFQMTPNWELSYFKNLVDEFAVMSEDFAKRMGMTENCIGMNGQLGYDFSTSKTAGGCSYATLKKISLMNGINNASTLAHEWIHSLDALVMFDSKKHINEHYTSYEGNYSVNQQYHISELTVALPDDGSTALNRVHAMRDFITNILSAEPEAHKKQVRDLMIQEVNVLLFNAIGEPYFTLPPEQLEWMHSDVMIDAVRNKLLDPTNQNVSENLKFNIMFNMGAIPYDQKAMENFVMEPNDSIQLKNGKKIIADIENYKALGPSQIVLSSEKLDDKIYNGIGLNSRTNVKNKAYYQTNVEVVARYLESQLYPTEAHQNNVGVAENSIAYRRDKDPKFDDFRKAVIKAIFGKESVKEMDIPETTKKTKTIQKMETVLVDVMVVKPLEAFDKIRISAGKIYNKLEAKTEAKLEKIKESMTSKNINLKIDPSLLPNSDAKPGAELPSKAKSDELTVSKFKMR